MSEKKKKRGEVDSFDGIGKLKTENRKASEGLDEKSASGALIEGGPGKLVVERGAKF